MYRFVPAFVVCVSLLIQFLPGRVSAQTPPGLAIVVSGGHPRLTLTGDIGSPCTVQYATNLVAAGNWLALTNFTLMNSPLVVTDSVGATNGQRFYRVVIAGQSNGNWVAAGSFVMGSPTNEVERGTNETQHTVTFSKGFYVGQYLVTQGAFLALMNTNPSYYVPSHGYPGDLTRPVEQVSWMDATNYCGRLTQQERAAGRIPTNWLYRLPTEAEWEYACRAGTATPFYYGANLSSGMANFYGEYEYVGGTGTVLNPSGTYVNRTTSVGSYQANGLGLYDMAGNLKEWCQDWFGNYGTNAVTDPQGPGSGSNRVLRGGAFNDEAKSCRSACRFSYDPTAAPNTVGFRLALTAGP